MIIYLISLKMYDIEEYFRQIISQHHSVDIADSEFKRLLAEDPQLRQEYSEWCHIVGSSERRGFRDFCEELIASQDSVWDSLTDFDNEE